MTENNGRIDSYPLEGIFEVERHLDTEHIDSIIDSLLVRIPEGVKNSLQAGDVFTIEIDKFDVTVSLAYKKIREYYNDDDYYDEEVITLSYEFAHCDEVFVDDEDSNFSTAIREVSYSFFLSDRSADVFTDLFIMTKNEGPLFDESDNDKHRDLLISDIFTINQALELLPVLGAASADHTKSQD